MQEILARIALAEPCSPVAVFMIDGRVKAVPRRTITTQQWIDRKVGYHVGTFDNTTPRWIILNKLREAR
jgi:hypothetical protein